jgi:hypothetical protein
MLFITTEEKIADLKLRDASLVGKQLTCLKAQTVTFESKVQQR